jgi:predicted O-linked N-acetylglucosamine transferase (SPINDLY family)
MAMYHHRAGQLGRAAEIYRQILQIEPAHVDALHLLGIAAQQLGRLDEAVASYRQAASLRPRDAAILGNLANALAEQGQLEEAAATYRQSLTLAPQLAETHFNLGNVLGRQGKPGEAAASYRQALALRPDFAPAHNNLGTVLLQQNLFEEALTHYRQAIALSQQPGTASMPLFLPQPHNNMGTALRKLGRLEEAASAYQEALRLMPGSAEILNNLGGVFADQQQLQKAADCFQQAIQIDPALADAHAGLGVALHDLGKEAEGLAHLREALRLKPGDRLRLALATRLPAIYQSLKEQQTCRERLIDELSRLRQQKVAVDLTTQTAVNAFYLAYHGMHDRDIQRDIAALQRAPAQKLPSRQAGPKIQVGFVSSFFHGHTIGRLMRGLIAQLTRCDFAVTVLYAGRQLDDEAQWFQQHADRYVLLPRHLPTARQIIAGQQLDILFYADIGMDPLTGTLAYSRLAPIQCVTWGHPVTTGIGTIDYFISSKDLDTDQAQDHYTETLVRLKTPPIYYYKLPLPAPPKERAHFGLARDDRIYACPQTLFKFHPDFDDLLAGILRADSRGTLVLIKPRLAHWEQQLRQRFAHTMPDVHERIRFVPAMSRPEYLNLLAVADVLLDPLHFGGGNTSYEGLAMGTPIVTLPSQFLRGRITFALYKQMQTLDCVVENCQDYINLALRLGTDPDYRSALRDKILAANHVLFENTQGVRDLEQFFRQAYESIGQRQ